MEGAGDESSGNSLAGSSYNSSWCGSKEVEEWALTLRGGRSPPLPPPHRQDSKGQLFAPHPPAAADATAGRSMPGLAPCPDTLVISLMNSYLLFILLYYAGK